MRTMKKPEIRKQEILKGAAAVFLKNGYEKTTIAHIARELDISQGLCYRYFSSKEEIYDGVIDAYAASIAGENLKHRPQHQSIRQWIDSIPHLLRSMETAERGEQQLYALLHCQENERMHRELCLRVVQKLLPSVTMVLEQAKAAGEIRITDCRKTAVFGLYGEMGLMMSGEADCTEAIQKYWRRLLEIEE